MKRFSILLVAIALAIFGLAACGDDDDDGDETAAVETTTTEETTAAGGGAGGTLDVSSPASGDTVYDQASLSSAAGPITVNYNNPSQVPHDVVIESEDGTEIGKTDLVSGGEVSTTVDLSPGTYTYYCDVPGHREGGMEGTLTVE